MLDPPYENPIERPALSLNTSSAVSASYWTVIFDKSAAAMAALTLAALKEFAAHVDGLLVLLLGALMASVVDHAALAEGRALHSSVVADLTGIMGSSAQIEAKFLRSCTLWAIPLAWK